MLVVTNCTDRPRINTLTKRSVWKHSHKLKVNRTVWFEGSDVPSQIEGLLNLDKTKPEAEGSSSLKRPFPACGPKSSTLLTFKVGSSAGWLGPVRSCREQEAVSGRLITRASVLQTTICPLRLSSLPSAGERF